MILEIATKCHKPEVRAELVEVSYERQSEIRAFKNSPSKQALLQKIEAEKLLKEASMPTAIKARKLQEALMKTMRLSNVQ